MSSRSHKEQLGWVKVLCEILIDFNVFKWYFNRAILEMMVLQAVMVLLVSR